VPAFHSGQFSPVLSSVKTGAGYHFFRHQKYMKRASAAPAIAMIIQNANG
jgi:hypothetical protein